MTFQIRVWTALFVLLSFKIFSQEKAFNYELELGTDNDNFIVYTRTDRNYTYGANASLRWRPTAASFFSKWFSNKQGNYIGAGFNLEAYTPNYLNDGTAEDSEMERSYAGWTYLTFQSTYTFQKSYVRFGIETGILGPASQVGQFQNWVHEEISGDSSVDWSNQIPNQPGVNITGTYAYELYKTSWFDFYGKADASLGNIFTYVQPQLNFRLGKFNAIRESVATQNGVLNTGGTNEFFLEYGLGMKLSAYNATIKGNIFATDSVFYSREINNNIYTMHLGLYFSFTRFSLIARYHYSTGEFERTQVHRYGTLNLLYRF